MKVSLESSPARSTAAGLLCVGLFEGEDLPDWLAGTSGSDDVRAGFRKLTVLRPGDDDTPERVLVVGLGKRDDFNSERARVAASHGVRQAQRYEIDALAWEVPTGSGPAACAIAGASILTAYRFDRLKSKPDPDRPGGPGELLLHGVEDERAADILPVAIASAEGANRARDLQSLPANIADPAYLAERAREIAAASEHVEAEVFDGTKIAELGMGGLESVGAGSARSRC